jgi:hypothetical protein
MLVTVRRFLVELLTAIVFYFALALCWVLVQEAKR